MKKNNSLKKGQVTAEFLVVVIALLFVLSFSFAVYSNNVVFFQGFDKISEMRVSGAKISSAFSSVLSAGDGSSSEFFFEKTADYNAVISGRLLVLSSKEATLDFPLPSASFDFSKFSFNKKIKISNNSGRVVVENA